MSTVTMSGVIISTSGAVILLLIGVIKFLVADHLLNIRKSLDALQDGQDEHSEKIQDHAVRLVRIETTLGLPDRRANG